MSDNIWFRIGIVGDQMAGKSSVMLALTGKAFRSEYEATITPIHVKRRLISSETGIHLKCEMIDTPGRDMYIPLIDLHLQRIDAIIVCYDITSKDSFDSIDKWLGLRCVPVDIPRVIVGCKADLKNYRQVHEDMVQAKVEQFLRATSYEVSSKFNFNIDAIFRNLHSSFVPQVEEKIKLREGVLELDKPPTGKVCPSCNISS